MLYPLLAIFLASFFALLFYERYKKPLQLILTLLISGVVIYFSTFLNHVTAGESIFRTIPWVYSMDIQLSFYMDGLSLFFALLISFLGFLVLLYSFKYMKEYPLQGRFFAYLLFFMGSMLGVVLSANLISLFVFWELTSFSSFLLIGFTNQKAESRRAARQALLITSGGGLALMSGFILLEAMTQSGFNIIEVLNSSESVENSPLVTATIILISIGAISKSAQFPLHFWLPNAMAAPTPVSAYLHSATMVKAGVYLIFRLNPIFSEVALWSNLLGITGAVTMTWGALKALQEDDLKKILAYTTISALGIFFMMGGLGGKEAFNAVMVYIMAHALYKGGLFLAAGSIDLQTGTRKISRLSGLIRKMPYTSAALILSFSSMAGIIPFLGFVGKESLYDVLYHLEHPMAVVYLILLFIAGVFFTTISIEVIYQSIFKRGMFTENKVTEPKFLMTLPPLILAIGGFFTGLMPGSTVEPLLEWSAASIYAAEPTMKLKLWHGYNQVFLLSMITLAAGAGLYFLRRPIRKFRKPVWLNSDHLYDKSLQGIEVVSRVLTMMFQNGFLRNYIAMVVAVFSLLMIYILTDAGLFVIPSSGSLTSGMQIYELVIIALITLAVVFLFKTKSRLIVTATFGIIGYSIALAFTLFSAPDVAITQFLAETLTLILLILILHRLPSYTLKKLVAHKKYLPIAVVFGLIMSLVTFSMLNLTKDYRLKNYFLEKSMTEGKGTNAVNVILVDFRALDTLGEITVLIITMIGIIALLKTKPEKHEI